MENTQPKRLMKSEDNKVIGGVCGGLGEYFNIDPVLVRAVFVIGTIAGAGSLVLVYIALMVLMPSPYGTRQPQAPKTVDVPVYDNYDAPLREVDTMKEKAKRGE